VIEISGLRHSFLSEDGNNDVLALDGINLAIARNEFVAIVGTSGCGKSTLLRLIAGLLKTGEGTIAIDGVKVTEPRQDIGFVFQSPTLLPWANVLDNVLFPLKLLGRDLTAGRRTAQELLALAGLAGFESKFPHQLSGGMQQRVAICRALVYDPAILLMDEPFGALDALTREEMSLELLRICAERPKTVLLVTHSISEAVLLGDRVVVMSPRPGRIRDILDVGIARPRDLRAQDLPEFQRCSHAIREYIFSARVPQHEAA
jgi:NitT/TauT family transport system ATP-binding protein